MSLLTNEELDVLSTEYWMFDLNVPSIVSIMRDTRQRITPFWLEQNSSNKTEMIFPNEHNTYEVWQKEIPIGRIGLGINGFDGHDQHYFVPNRDTEMAEEEFVEVRFGGEMLYQIINVNDDKLVYRAFNYQGTEKGITLSYRNKWRCYL